MIAASLDEALSGCASSLLHQNGLHGPTFRNSFFVRDVAMRMRFMRQWKVIIGADADGG